MKKATATVALTTTGDCDPFWLTACALTAAPNFSMFKKALTAYSNGTRRQQFSHRYALRFHQRHTGPPSRSSPYSYFSTFPPINEPIGFGGHTSIFRNENPQSIIESSEAPTIASTSPPASSVLSAPSTAITRSTRKSLTVSESRLWHRWWFYLHSLHPGHAQAKVHYNAGQAHYEAPYEMLHWFGKSMHDAASNEISYQAPLHNLRWFG